MYIYIYIIHLNSRITNEAMVLVKRFPANR